MHSVHDLVGRMNDINGHVSRNIDGFASVHIVYGVSQSKLEGRM